jgi:ionotropic glutamate receptor
MAPLSTTVWLCILLAYVGVTLILFLVTRFSPYEWRRNRDTTEKTFENDFDICNTLWFCLAACMQQGVDIAPK